MSRAIHLDKVKEILRSKNFHVEFSFTSSKESFVVIRHTQLGFRSVICVQSRYTLVSTDKTFQLEPAGEIKEQNLYSPLDIEGGSNDMYAETIKMSTVDMDIASKLERYKKCLSSSQAFGLFFWGHGFVASVWYDHFGMYRTNENSLSFMDIYPMIGIDSLLSWSSKLTQNLETMVQKFYGILKSVSDQNQSSVEEIMKKLRKYKELKNEMQNKLTGLSSELKNVTDLLKETDDEINKNELEFQTNTGIASGDVFRKNRAKDTLEKLYTARIKLYGMRDVTSSKISSIYYSMDSVTYHIKTSITELEKVLTED
jgi:hypothetical protein